MSIFFDFVKAYDTTWKYGIMKDSYDMDHRGRLPLFIHHFFYPKDKRQIRVKSGDIPLNFMIKKWVFQRVAFSLSPYLLL